MVWSLIAIVGIAYGILGLVLYYMQPSFIYVPTRDVVYTPAEIGLAYEKLSIRTDDNISISAWYIPSEKARATVLFCHGNGGNIMHRLDTISILNEQNLNVLIFDYRGYGNSQGKPSEDGTYLDARAAWDWLVNEKKIKADSIIVFGRSLGSAVASWLASNVECKGLVTESAFTSFADIGTKFYPYMPVRWFARFSYKTINYVRNIDCPLLVIHSRDDEFVPFEFGLRIYEAGREPKEFLEIFGKHNDGFLMSGDTYKQGLEQWITFVLKHKQEKKHEVRRIS